MTTTLKRIMHSLIVAYVILGMKISQCRGNALNVLMIVVDDLRVELGCYGNDFIKSPNIDKLVTSSTKFTNAHAQLAQCGPSRSSFLTSRRLDTLTMYAHTHPYWRKLPGNFTTLPEHFKNSGYHTYSIGKVFHPSHNDDYPYSWSELPYHPPTIKYKNSKVCHDCSGILHSNAVCPVNVTKQPGDSLPDIQSKNEALTALERLSNGSKPFFLGVGFHKPHLPFKYPENFNDLYSLKDIPLPSNPHRPVGLPSVAWNPFMSLKSRQDVAALNISFPYGEVPQYYQRQLRRSYYASISYIDSLIGEIMEKVENLELLRNTIIVFVSDHGWSLGEHGEWAKFSNYDLVTRIPLSIFVPESVTRKPMGEIHEMVELVDLFPTLAELAEIEKLPQCYSRTTKLCSEGQSLVPLMNGTLPAGYVNISFTQYPRPSLTPHKNSDKPNTDDINYMGYAVKSTVYRYVRWVSFNHKTSTPNMTDVEAEELYDIRTDPDQNYNLIHKQELSSVVEYHVHALLCSYQDYRV